MGKVRCEKIECGMCDNVFNNLEALETHISTCEVYKFDECGFITTKLVVVKIHLDKEHNGGTEMQINHLKQSRANREEYDCYFYTKKHLFVMKLNLLHHYSVSWHYSQSSGSLHNRQRHKNTYLRQNNLD